MPAIVRSMAVSISARHGRLVGPIAAPATPLASISNRTVCRVHRTMIIGGLELGDVGERHLFGPTGV
jgi:hypothetical protein